MRPYSTVLWRVIVLKVSVANHTHRTQLGYVYYLDQSQGNFCMLLNGVPWNPHETRYEREIGKPAETLTSFWIRFFGLSKSINLILNIVYPLSTTFSRRTDAIVVFKTLCSVSNPTAKKGSKQNLPA